MRIPKGHNILIIDPSEVILNGLSTLMHQLVVGEPRLSTSWDEALKIKNLADIRLGIIGSGLIHEWVFRKSSILKAFENARWAAFIYAPCYYEQDPHLDGVLKINDSSDTIRSGLKSLLSIDKPEEPQQPLSEREIEVLQLLVQGKSQKEIAHQLNLSIHTVNSHRKNISEKTGIKSIAGLTLFALSQKYILP